ncbi:hypothetical protein ACFLRF_06345 [Candidatus Altiarchaeota archaeon]
MSELLDLIDLRYHIELDYLPEGLRPDVLLVGGTEDVGELHAHKLFGGSLLVQVQVLNEGRPVLDEEAQELHCLGRQPEYLVEDVYLLYAGLWHEILVKSLLELSSDAVVAMLIHEGKVGKVHVHRVRDACRQVLTFNGDLLECGQLEERGELTLHHELVGIAPPGLDQLLNAVY